MEINKICQFLVCCVSQGTSRERDLYQFSFETPFPAAFHLTERKQFGQLTVLCQYKKSLIIFFQFVNFMVFKEMFC